jgi:hypothetical protein
VPSKAPCITCKKRPKLPGRHRCVWCFLPTLPAEEQVRQARHRRSVMESKPDYVERARVPKDQWPEGERFCSGCQMFVPLEYTRGSMCMGHASLSAHASHLQRTYVKADGTPFTREDFDELYAWQGGRCYFCGQRQQKIRLAVDHDHLSGVVRGLLCSGSDYSCNHRLLGALEGKAGQDGDILAIARRIVAYLEMPPMQRMLAGQNDTPTQRRAAAKPTPPSWPVPGKPPF